MKTLLKAIPAACLLLGLAISGYGASLQFDGVDDYVKPPSGSIVLSNRSFTIEFWVRRAATNRDEYVLCSGSGADFNSNRYLFVGFRPNNCVVFGFYGNTLTLVTSPITDGAWHHYACSYDSSSRLRRIYLDGNLIGQDTASAQFQGGSDLLIGAQHTGPYFNGWVDEVRIWGTVRTQAEIQQSMRRLLQGDEAGLLAWFPLNEGTGATTADASGHGLTAVLNNGILWNAENAFAPVEPISLTGPATLVTQTNAQLTGWVNPNGAPTTNHFEWGTASTALEFNGVNSVVEFNRPVSNDFTIEFWFQSSQVIGLDGHWWQGAGLVDGEVDGVANDFGVSLGNGRVLFGTGNPDTTIRSPTVLADGQWHHVAATREMATGALKLFVDGSQVAASTTAGRAVLGGPSKMRLGSLATGFNFFDGSIDEVRLWSVVRSPAEIRANLHVPVATNAPGLVAYFRLEEATGPAAADATGHGFNGTLMNGPARRTGVATWFDRTTPRQPVAGTNSVLNLDGYDDHVVVPAGYWFTNGDFTIECKVFMRSYSHFGRILDFGNYAGGDEVILCLGPGTSGGLYFYSYTPGRSVVTSPDPVPTNQWVHLAATLHGSWASLYLNGVLWASGYLNLPNNVQQTRNYLGRPLWADETHGDMLMDEVRIWNVARTAEQIRQFMNESVPMNDPNLLLNYRFDEPSGPTVLDSRTTSPRNGTLVNGASLVSCNPVTATLTNLAPGTVYYFRSVAESTNGTGLGSVERFATLAPSSGTALAFAGADDYVRVKGLGQRLPAAEVTVEFWVRVHSPTEDGRAFNLSPDVSTNRFLVHLGRPDNWVFWDFGDAHAGGGRIYYAVPEDITGTWQHFAFVASQSGNCMKIFRNGVEEKTASQFSNFVPGDYDLILGLNLDGELDEFRVWSKALSAIEVQQSMHLPLTGKELDLVAYYRMDEGSGGVLMDATTNASHGLLFNRPLHVPSEAPIDKLIAVTKGFKFQARDRVELQGSVNSSSSQIRAWFEWGTDANYGQTTAFTNVPSDAGEVSISAVLSGLTEGLTYHYRMVASNDAGVVFGEGLSFQVLVATNLSDGGPGSLRQAIADALPGAWITITNAGTIILTSGELLLNKDVTINGPGASLLAISGNRASRVFNVAAGISVNISGLTICDGRATNGANGSGYGISGLPGGNGGGIWNAGTLVVSNCIITNNVSGNGGTGAPGGSPGPGNPGGSGGIGGNGGGIYNASAGILDLDSCTIAGNFSGMGGQGGVGGTGANSSSTGWYGGVGGSGGSGGDGAGVFNAGYARLERCLFTSNTNSPAGRGGNGGNGGENIPDFLGIHYHWGGNGGNGGLGGAGGDGAGLYSDGEAALVNCTFSGNNNGAGAAGGTGGNGGHGSTTGNRGGGGNGGNGGSGAGVANSRSLSILSCTIVGGISGTNGVGGGLGGGTAGSAVPGNSGRSGSGGGIFTVAGGTPVELVNTVIAQNSNSAGLADDFNGAVNSLGHNLIGSIVGSIGFGASGDLLNYPAMLAPLADNGGPTLTHAPWPESPVLNAGTNFSADFATDQRGSNRIACAVVDIGAFERSDCLPVPPPASGSALYFDGVDDFILGAPELCLTNQSFTIEVWARRLSTNTMDFIVGQGGGGDSTGLHFGFHYAPPFTFNEFAFGFYNNDLLTTNRYADTDWHHWAGTYDVSTSLRCLYRDGLLVASNTASAHYQGTGTLFIGALPWGDCFHGFLDEVRIWNVARTPAQIRENFRHPLFGSEPGLLLYYRFDEWGGTQVGNSAPTGAAFDGTLLNGPFFTPSGPDLLTVFGRPQTLVDGFLADGSLITVTNTAQITLQTDYPGGHLCYSLDGSEPLPGADYLQPFNLATSAVLRVRAWNGDRTEWQEAAPVTIKYIPRFDLILEGVLGGDLVINPPGGSFLQDTLVSLQAVPASGWTFVRWERDASGTNSSLQISMNGSKVIRAVFATALETSSPSGGSISRSPDLALYPYGSIVQLSALPAGTNLFFKRWGGAAAGQTNNPLAFVVASAMPQVSAEFDTLQVNYHSLSVEVKGQGTVQQNPQAQEYAHGANVALTAVAAQGWEFAGWSGDAIATDLSVNLVMDRSKTVTATFRSVATNRAPAVLMLAPANDSTNYIPGPLVLTAEASDDQVVAAVDFFAQSGTNAPVLLAHLVGSPYEFSWPNPAVGQHTLFARASDDQGLAATSAPVLVTIKATEFRFSQATNSVGEAGGPLQVRVFKSGGAARVNYRTVEGAAKPVNSDGYGDYEHVAGSLYFTASETEKTIVIPILNDLASEGDEDFALQLMVSGDGSVLGSPSCVTNWIRDDEAAPGLSSSLEVAVPNAWPQLGKLRVDLLPPGAEFQWRFRWETTWRPGGTVVSNLEPGSYTVDFKPVSGYIAPPPSRFTVSSGAIATNTRFYIFIGHTRIGSLSVELQPASARWRLQNHATWFEGGHVVDNILEGEQILEFEPVPGWLTPPPAKVLITNGQVTAVSVSYQAWEDWGTEPAEPNALSAAQQQNNPYMCLGQLSTTAGLSSGFVVRDRVVLTAGHALFDAARLCFVDEALWFFQRHKNLREPLPQKPRGWYVFSGYAAARTNGQGQVSLEAFQNDVAVLYFQQSAGRGGFGGFLASDAATNWLTGLHPKLLAGYPVFGRNDFVPGKMYATAPIEFSFSSPTGAVYQTSALRSYPGNSGGPLCVLPGDDAYHNFYYPAAVYLGEFEDTSVVRIIDTDVVGLINRAVYSAYTGTNYSGGGVVLLTPGTGGELFLAGDLRIVLGPQSALDAGAGWRLVGHPLLDYYSDNAALYSLFAAGYTVEFRNIPGFVTPTNLPVQIVAGQITTGNAIYLPLGPGMIAPARGPDGVFAFSLSGQPGKVYVMEASTNLGQPNWTIIATNIMDANGTWQFSDPASTNLSRRYYRARQE